MKIAMFGHRAVFSRFGGIDVAVTALSCVLAEQGHQVVCYDRCSGKKPEKPHPGISVRKLPSLKGKGLGAVSGAFFAALCSGVSNADIIHIHGEGPSFFAFFPRWMGKRVVVTVHGLDWQREKWQHSFGRIFLKWGERMAVRYAHELIVLSEAANRYFRETYGRETVQIPNGASPAEPAPPDLIQKQFGLEKEEYLLFLGRLVPEKGVHHLIRAFRKLPMNKKLVIAGEGSDSDDYVRQLRHLAAGDGRILFAGFVQGQLLRELYTNAWLYVLPSSLEGMPLGLMEAICYGCPCLVSDIPECRQLLGSHGIAVPPGDERALENTLRMLWERPQLLSTFRGRAADLPGWAEVTARTLELYQ